MPPKRRPPSYTRRLRRRANQRLIRANLLRLWPYRHLPEARRIIETRDMDYFLQPIAEGTKITRTQPAIAIRFRSSESDSPRSPDPEDLGDEVSSSTAHGADVDSPRSPDPEVSTGEVSSSTFLQEELDSARNPEDVTGNEPFPTITFEDLLESPLSPEDVTEDEPSSTITFEDLLKSSQSPEVAIGDESSSTLLKEEKHSPRSPEVVTENESFSTITFEASLESPQSPDPESTSHVPNENGSARNIPKNPNSDTSQPINPSNRPKDEASTTATGSADLSENKEGPGQNRDEAGKKIKWDCAQHFSDQADQGTSATRAVETQENTATGQENNPTAETNVASDEPPRNKCAYGSRCYRRNTDHRRQFSHPGDQDYDVPDTRPECAYGVRCYRKNPQHKRDFKHTNLRPSRAQTPIRGRASDATSGTEQSSAEESVDESDYEPSYWGTTSDDYRSDFDGLSEFEGTSDGEDDK